MSEYRDEVDEAIQLLAEVIPCAEREMRSLIELGVRLGLEAAAKVSDEGAYPRPRPRRGAEEGEGVTDEQIEHCARELCDEWYRAHVETTQLTWRNRSEADKVAFRQLARRVIADQMSDGARVLALLKRIEWALDSICPCCRVLYVTEFGPPPPHEPDCELAALIRELSD